MSPNNVISMYNLSSFVVDILVKMLEILIKKTLKLDCGLNRPMP